MDRDGFFPGQLGKLKTARWIVIVAKSFVMPQHLSMLWDGIESNKERSKFFL